MHFKTRSDCTLKEWPKHLLVGVQAHYFQSNPGLRGIIMDCDNPQESPPVELMPGQYPPLQAMPCPGSPRDVRHRELNNEFGVVKPLPDVTILGI